MNKSLTMPPHTLSIVIPLYNEEACAAPLLESVSAALADYAHAWELILVDDGSTDGTARELDRLAREYGSFVRVAHLARNFRQTAALQAGIDMARGNVIVTMDGDLQNDPLDIPLLVSRLLNEDMDVVCGWRKNRKDGLWLRKIPSRIANRLIGKITGVRLNDYGCTLKAFRADVLRQVRLYGEMHRFIPAWLATVTSTHRIVEQSVAHHPRTLGSSKYGISRVFRVILDILSVYFFMRFRDRPGHFFGGIGLALMTLSAAVLGYLFFIKVFLGDSIGQRPLLMVGFFAGITGIQCALTGVLAEILSRIYSGERSQPYRIRSACDGENAGWHMPENLRGDALSS